MVLWSCVFVTLYTCDVAELLFRVFVKLCNCVVVNAWGS